LAIVQHLLAVDVHQPNLCLITCWLHLLPQLCRRLWLNLLLQVGDGVFEVLSTSGDTHLGGDDFDKRIVDFLADDFKQNEGIDLRKDRQALQRLTEAAEKAKMELSSVAQTSISLPFITATADGPKHIESQLSRAKFESICSDLLDRCRIPVEQALKDAKLKLSDLNEVWSHKTIACLLAVAKVSMAVDCCTSKLLH